MRSRTVLGTDMAERLPESHLIDERECDFLGALAALHELLGATVTMWILGAQCDSLEAAVTVSARVEGGLEFGDDDESAVGFRIGDAVLVISPDSLAGAWRSEYERCGDRARWLVLTLLFDGGARVEIEEYVG
jgi:hypothetical protein